MIRGGGWVGGITLHSGTARARSKVPSGERGGRGSANYWKCALPSWSSKWHNQHLHRCEGHHETVINLQEQKTGHLPAGITCANIANSWSHVLRSSQAGADKVSGENFTAISQEDQSSMLYGHWTFTAVAGRISGAQLNSQWSAINPLVLRQTLNECWAGFCQSDDWPGHKNEIKHQHQCTIITQRLVQSILV